MLFRNHARNLFFITLLAFALAFPLAGVEGRWTLGFVLLTVMYGLIEQAGLRWLWRVWVGQHLGRRVVGALLGLSLAGAYLAGAIWFWRPALWPQDVGYDFIANRQVTEQLVDPALFKVEQWEILGRSQPVLFVHPAAAGSTALVYPVKIEQRTTFRAEVAVAPGAWTAAGDGVTFSVYVEDEAGMHLLYSRYVDPKHHQQDKRWIPVQVDLSAYGGRLARIILATGSGPAGDAAYDWAGWGTPRLTRPVWP